MSSDANGMDAASDGAALVQGAPGRKTVWFYQWLRALGALAVVALHVVRECELSEPLAAAAGGLISAESLLAVPLARWAVPVFFMVSGALMLDPRRDVDAAKVARHLWRIAFVLLTLGYAFALMELAYAGSLPLPELLAAALSRVLLAQSWDHLWYLYATLGLYALTLPLRALLARLERRGKLLLLLALWGCLCVLPALAPEGHLSAWASWGFPLPYYLAGNVLSELPADDVRTYRAVLALGALALAAMLALSWQDVVDAALPERGLALPFGAAAFALASRRLDLPAQGGLSWVGWLAGYSFGIYLLHPLFAHLLVRVGPLAGVAAGAGAAGVLALQLLVFALGVLGSVALVRLLRQLPGFAGKV